jgi:hypothetical protein
VKSTNADKRFFRALQNLRPVAATQVSYGDWEGLFDEMIGDEQAMLSIARQFPGVLTPPSVVPMSARKQFDKLVIQQLADRAALRLALDRAGVPLCQ